ncbi:hypothetical protein RHGRI_010146 [Rhododendron griersonianum]|uniref:Zinc finger GRF-type domain-containing protein n=1 Tax=Rhododendron griersonianum TaxID=479676 RepID=A0AAV6KHD3_9ERIC|nr:hypothetical protein RHGRI_010146 [Rhododendron griersonianum]
MYHQQWKEAVQSKASMVNLGFSTNAGKKHLEESRTKKNPGRKFFGCPNYKVSDNFVFILRHTVDSSFGMINMYNKDKSIEGLPSVVQKSEDSVGLQTNEVNENIDELKKEVKVLKRKMQKMEKQVNELYILNQRRNMGVPNNCTILLFAIVMLVIWWLF